MPRIPSLGPRGEGWVALQSLLLIAIPVVAWRASLDEVVETPLIALMRAVGTVALFGGLAVIVAGAWYLRRDRSFSVLPRPLESGALVQDGPYRFVRHPVYAGLIVTTLGVAMIRVSWLIGLLALALAIVLDLKRRREEAWLSERYEGYAGYRARTKALVPFVY
jgi:protein-S-isoprenylcysteine O-methyltransferase Ste14